MDKRRRLLTVVLAITLLVSLTLACMPGLPSGGVTEEETAAPEARCGDGVCEEPENAENCSEDCAPVEVETPEASPPPPEEELPFTLDVEALEDLNSFTYSMHIDGLSTLEGEVEQVKLDLEGQRQSTPTRAEQLSFSSVTDGESTEVEVIYLEEQNKMWMREGGAAWQEMPVMDESMLQIFEMFSMMHWWDVFFTGDPAAVQYVGQEMMNGVQSHHYRSTEGTAWGAFVSGCTFASIEDDIWVAVDGSFPVKRELGARANCQDQSGEIHFLMELRNINEPVSVAPPM